MNKHDRKDENFPKVVATFEMCSFAWKAKTLPTEPQYQLKNSVWEKDHDLVSV